MQAAGRERFAYPALDDPDDKQRRRHGLSSLISRYIDLKTFVLAIAILLVTIFAISTIQTGNPRTHSRKGSSTSSSTGSTGNDDEQAIGPLNWNPRVRILPNHFATEQDAAELIRLGEIMAQQQTPEGGEESHSKYCLHLNKDAPEVLRRIEHKLSIWSVLPPSHGEAFCWIRQQAGESLPVLTDDESARTDDLLASYGKRKVTFIMHLNTIKEGAETTFPKTANGALNVPPFAGDAMLLWNQFADRSECPNAVWGSNAPTDGVKWTLVRFMREKPMSSYLFLLLIIHQHAGGGPGFRSSVSASSHFSRVRCFSIYVMEAAMLSGGGIPSVVTTTTFSAGPNVIPISDQLAAALSFVWRSSSAIHNAALADGLHKAQLKKELRALAQQVDVIIIKLNMSEKVVMASTQFQETVIIAFKSVVQMIDAVKKRRGEFWRSYFGSKVIRKLCRDLLRRVGDAGRVSFSLRLNLTGEVSVDGDTGANVIMNDQLEIKKTGHSTQITSHG